MSTGDHWEGTELSLTTFCTSVLSVTGKTMLISDYNCVCGHLSPKVSLLPLFQSYVSNIQKDSLWSSAGLTIFDLKSALIVIKLPELHFG